MSENITRRVALLTATAVAILSGDRVAAGRQMTLQLELGTGATTRSLRR